jgi:hypothetical protein
VLIAGRLQVQFLMRAFDFSTDLFFQVLTQPLTEKIIGNLPGGEGQPAHKADILTTIFELIM